MFQLCMSSTGKGYGRKWIGRLRFVTWYIGTLVGKLIELAKILHRRKIIITCIKETKWMGAKANAMDGYKLRYLDFNKARNRAGIMAVKELADQVVEVRHKNNHIMSMKLVVGVEILNVVSFYAPQIGLMKDIKRQFQEDLDMVIQDVPWSEKLFVGGDFNGYIGAEADGYDTAHGGFGFDERSIGGVSVLDFAVAYDLLVANSFFKKKEDHFVTFRSGPIKTQIGYFLIVADSRRLCKDFKVIQSEYL